MTGGTDVKYVDGGDNSVLRSALYDAYAGQCWWCNKPTPYWVAQIDHLLPKTASQDRIVELAQELGLQSSFDVHDPRNLGPICSGCNQEKSSTDFTKTDRILTKLRRAERLRSKVIRLVTTFSDCWALASALLRAKEADLSNPEARRTLEAHAPGFVQALANLEGFAIDYTDHRTIEVERGRGELLGVVVSLDAASRRALTVMEDVCGSSLAQALTEPVQAVVAQIHGDVTSEFEGIEVIGGSTYAGPLVSTFMNIDLGSIAVSRSGTYFEFAFDGTFEAVLSASLMQDEKDPGTLEEVQGEAVVAGTYYFTAEWDPSEDDELSLGEPGLEYLESNVWTE